MYQLQPAPGLAVKNADFAHPSKDLVQYRLDEQPEKFSTRQGTVTDFTTAAFTVAECDLAIVLVDDLFFSDDAPDR